MSGDDLDARMAALWDEIKTWPEGDDTDDPIAAMLDAAQWQIESVGKDDHAWLDTEADRLYGALKNGPIDDVMINGLVQFVIRYREQSRQLKKRGRPPQSKRKSYIRHWAQALQEQCGMPKGEAYRELGTRLHLSPEAIRSSVEDVKK